ncbi:MAG: AraC family transcriptional regulator [Clostridia bacterium]|nr:AraC family transcriptional regulator [Clostridia bacterium]
MQHLRRKVAYIQGLAEGIDLRHSKEGRILENIIRVLEEMAEAIDHLDMRHNELETYMESIDEDLQDLEEDVYEETDLDEYSELDAQNTEYVELECPGCQDVVCFESDIIEDEDVIEVTCPNCDEIVYINDGSFEIENFDQDRYHYSRSKNTEDI